MKKNTALFLLLAILFFTSCSDQQQDDNPKINNSIFTTNNDFDSKESTLSGSFQLRSADSTTTLSVLWGGATSQYRGLIMTLVPDTYSGSINLLQGCSECIQIYISELNINSTDYVYSHKAASLNNFAPSQFDLNDFNFVDGSIDTINANEIGLKYKDWKVQDSQGSILLSNFNYKRTSEYTAHLEVSLSMENVLLKNDNEETLTLTGSVQFTADDTTPPPPTTTNPEDSNGCSTYSSSITDPQIKPLCQAAWSYSCSGDTQLVQQSCATLEGWNEKSNCSYCQ